MLTVGLVLFGGAVLGVIASTGGHRWGWNWVVQLTFVAVGAAIWARFVQLWIGGSNVWF